MGYLPKTNALFPHLDVIGNVTFGLARLRARRPPAPRRRMGSSGWESAISRRGPRRRCPERERQRVALAGPLARRPAGAAAGRTLRVARSGRARELRVSLRAWLGEWRLPALIVSHDPVDAVTGGSHRGGEAGRVVQQGTLDELRPCRRVQLRVRFRIAARIVRGDRLDAAGLDSWPISLIAPPGTSLNGIEEARR